MAKITVRLSVCQLVNGQIKCDISTLFGNKKAESPDEHHSKGKLQKHYAK